MWRRLIAVTALCVQLCSVGGQTTVVCNCTAYPNNPGQQFTPFNDPVLCEQLSRASVNGQDNHILCYRVQLGTGGCDPQRTLCLNRHQTAAPVTTASPSAATTRAPSTTAPMTQNPTATPTALPTAAPTAAPTTAPTATPTAVPSRSPSSLAPTATPTSDAPTDSPTFGPTVATTPAPRTVPTIGGGFEDGGGADSRNSIFLIVVVLVVSALFILAMLLVARQRRKREGQKAAAVTGGIVLNQGFAPINTPTLTTTTGNQYETPVRGAEPDEHRYHAVGPPTRGANEYLVPTRGKEDADYLTPSTAAAEEHRYHAVGPPDSNIYHDVEPEPSVGGMYEVPVSVVDSRAGDEPHYEAATGSAVYALAASSESTYHTASASAPPTTHDTLYSLATPGEGSSKVPLAGSSTEEPLYHMAEPPVADATTDPMYTLAQPSDGAETATDTYAVARTPVDLEDNDFV